MSDEPRGRWLNARLAFFLTLAVPLATAHAQRASTFSVEGIAYDSLAGAPLRRAVVTAPTAGRSVTTDDRGRFRLDSMPVGVQVITLQHSAFDSLGACALRRTLSATTRYAASHASLSCSSPYAPIVQQPMSLDVRS